MARRRRRRGSRRRAREASEAPRKRRRRRARRASEAPRRRRSKRRHNVKGHRRRGGRVRRHMSYETPKRRRRRGGRRRRARAREYPHQVRRTKRGRFTSRRRAGKYRTRLVGRITGETRRRRSYRRRVAYENPLDGMELVTAIVISALGYSTADIIDRFVVGRERKDANGVVMGQRWESAPLTDDLLVRGGIGVAVAAVPLVAAHFVSSSMGRSALQGFGIGAAVHLVGKAVDDLAAYLLRNGTAAQGQDPLKVTGRRLFGNELNARKAIALTANPALPADYYGTAGLGAAPCGVCGKPTAGLGSWEMASDCGCSCRTGPPPAGAPPWSCGPYPRYPQYPQYPGLPPGYTPVPPGGFTPPGTVTVPGTPAIPATPGFPATPGLPGQPPTVAIPGTPPYQYVPNPVLPYPQVVGINGLGDVGQAEQVLRQHEPAYRAIRSNAGVFAAVRNNTATPAQREHADRVTSQHAEGIRAIGQFAPATITTAARGLGFLDEERQGAKPLPTFPGARRHRESDDTAE